MDQNKTIAIVVGALAVLAAVTFGLSGADAATWHDYKGDIYAGHAYGLLVPPNAKNYEVNFAGGPNASAKLAIYDPVGARLGYFGLSPTLTSASIAGPAQGRHVLYVYDIVGDGALTLRVDSDTAPPADLQQVPLVRNDISLASQDAAAKLDKSMTAKLDTAPVFVTLLYDGSAQDLTASIASAKGEVVAITHESGSAFSPGVWTSQSGQRTSTPANLDGVAYTVTAHAEKFQGSMILTTLSLDLKAPQATTPGAPAAPEVKNAKAGTLAPGTFAINRGKAVAFVADKGTLVLQDPQANHAKNQSSYVNDVISIYAPDDKLVQVVKLTGENASASIELPVAGEYVAYVSSASNKAVLAHLAGASTAPTVRELTLAKEKVELKGDAAKNFTLKNAPVELMLRATRDSPGVLSSVSIQNEKGVVAESNDIVSVGGGQMFAWGDLHRENFQAGEHTLRVSGIIPAHYELTSVYFVRATEAKAVAAAAPQPAPESPDAPPAQPSPEGPPVPPAAPAPAGPDVPRLPELPALPPL